MYTWNKNFTMKQFTIAFAGILVVVLFSYYHLVLLRQQKELSSIHTRYISEKQQLDMIQGFAAAHPDIDGYLSELDVQLKNTNKMLPDSGDISGFILEIHQAAAQAGVHILQIKPSPAALRQGYSEIAVELAVQGDYFRQLAFLKSLENDMRFTVIRAVNMQAKQGFLETKYNILIYNTGGQPNHKDELVKKQPQR